MRAILLTMGLALGLIGCAGPGTHETSLGPGSVVPSAAPSEVPSTVATASPSHTPAPTPKPIAVCLATQLAAKVTAWQGATGHQIARITAHDGAVRAIVLP